jgi:hypothetical protein
MHIKEVVLATRSLIDCEAFYRDNMGFPVQRISAAEIAVSIGHSKLNFREVKTLNPLYHFAFSVPNNQFQNALTWISDRATILPYEKDSVIADFINWNARAFYFRDHDENILECITHFDRKSNQDGSFTSNSFEGLVEIGMPVDEVASTCAALHQQHHIPYFKKGPQLKDFAVMGDDEGMLIVTKNGRGWLPTQEPAGKYPLTIKLDSGNGEIVLELN